MVDSVLSRGCVEYQQHLAGAVGGFTVNDAVDLGEFVHQVLFIMKPSGGIADQDIRLARLCRADAVKHHCRGVAAFGVLHQIALGAFRPDFQLFNRRRAEGIRRRDNTLLALLAETGAHLADGRGLAHAVDPDDQNNGRLGVELERQIPFQHFGNGLNQQVAYFLWVGGTGLFDLTAQGIADFLRGQHSHVARNQQFLQFLKQFLVHLGEPLEQRVDLTHNAVARLL